ncbi:MAG: substrate binding domain-containing protein [Acetobacteraceae bacterium]|nr:substrate binding domain-containing protein [Acetobacteraceae bacterium]
MVTTQQGPALYERMREALRNVDEAVEAAADHQGKLCGRLRITAPMSFGTLYLARILADFTQLHPELELAIDLDHRMLDLISGGYDLAIRIGRLDDSSLTARKLCVSPRVVCCSPAYAQERALLKTIDELTTHRCIDYANVHASRLWQFAPAGSNARPRVVVTRSRIVVNNGEVMRDMAIAGLGLAVLPLFIAIDALRTGQLIHVLPHENPLPDTIYAVYPPVRHLPQRVRAFIDHFAAALAHGPPWEGSSGEAQSRMRIAASM